MFNIFIYMSYPFKTAGDIHPVAAWSTNEVVCRWWVKLVDDGGGGYWVIL